MAIRRFSHLGICVSDLARSLTFYRDALGFRELSGLEVAGEAAETLLAIRDLDLRAAFLERDGVRIELLHFVAPGHRGSGEPRPMNALGLTHLSLRVDDLEALLGTLERAGARVLRATQTWNPELEAGAVFVTDPDGTRIELLQMRRELV